MLFVFSFNFKFINQNICHQSLNRLGRKYPLVVFMFCAAVCTYLIPMFYTSRPWLTVIFYFLAKYVIGAAQLTCMIFTAELYPTQMRSTGVGLSVAIARLGGVWGPQISILKSTLNSVYVPFLIFTAFTSVACLLALFLPETLNKPLPENIVEAKDLNRYELNPKNDEK
jgi:MFS family permease